MKRLRSISVFLILLTACTNVTIMKQDINSNLKLLPLILKRETVDEKFFIVNRQTWFHIDFKNKDELKSRKEYIRKNLNIPDYDISDLLDQLFEINKSSVNLNIESDKARGYIIDSTGESRIYFKENGGGWDKLYKDNPKALGLAYVSVPAYDKENGIILVYKSTTTHSRAGAGWIAVYKLRDGKVEHVDSVVLWKS